MEYWEELWDAADPNWRDDPPEMAGLNPNFCDYLPGRTWKLKMIRHAKVDRLMLLGGQRFGYAYCVTGCPHCRACVPARISVADFTLTRSQRRTVRRNNDLRISFEAVSYTPEKFKLLLDFVEAKFGPRRDRLDTEEDKIAYYLSFHLHHPAHSREVHYRDGEQLVGISILDFGEQGLYSHYFFYDLQASRRRLGIYSFLQEIDWCKRLGYPYLYIGFLNQQSKALSYKAQFAHLQVLRPQLGWVPYLPG